MRLMITFFSIFVLLIIINYGREYYFNTTKITLKNVTPEELELTEIIQKKDLENTLVQILNDQKIKTIFKRTKKNISYKEKVTEAKTFAEEMVITQYYRNLRNFFPDDEISKKIWLILLTISPQHSIPYKDVLNHAYINDLHKNERNSSNVIVSIISALPDDDYQEAKLHLVMLHTLISKNKEKSKELGLKLLDEILKTDSKENEALFPVCFNTYLHAKKKQNDNKFLDVIEILKLSQNDFQKLTIATQYINFFPLLKDQFLASIAPIYPKIYKTIKKQN